MQGNTNLHATYCRSRLKFKQTQISLENFVFIENKFGAQIAQTKPPEINMYFPFCKSGKSKVVDDDVPTSPNLPLPIDYSGEYYESSLEASGPKKRKLQGKHFELLEHKFLERDENRKLPLPYIGMIAEAISSSPDKKMILTEIYTYMERHFFQYLSGKPRWRNTVRHNLSFHNCFVKCECSRRGNRSHFWSIHPDYIEQFKRGNFTKTLSPPRPQINTSHYELEHVIRRNSYENYRRFFPHTGYENYLHCDTTVPLLNTNNIYQGTPTSTSNVLYPHQHVWPIPVVETSSSRGIVQQFLFRFL